MRKQFTIITLLFLALTSCDDFLEVAPDLQVSIDEQMANQKGVLEAYTGIYRDVEALLSSKSAIYADVQGGNISFSPSITSKQITIPSTIENSYNFNDQFENSDYKNYYEAAYKIINQVNILLQRFTEFDFLAMDNANQLQAELLIIRAFMHYQIAIQYAQNYHFKNDASHLGIIYNTTTLSAGVDFPSRENMNNTYRLIKEDLDAGLNLFANTQLLSGPSYSYFNKENTTAIYARIALQMNDWDAAKSLATTVINTAGIALSTTKNYVQEWEENILPVNEVLMEFSAPKSSDGTVSSSISEHYSYNSSINYKNYVASSDLLAMYSAVDIRKNMFIETNLNTAINGIETQKNYYFTKKFQGDAGTVLIRLSELYLIRAEANAQLGLISEALTDLNSIRNRANLETLFSLGDDFEEIFKERRRELAFEGHLLFDIIRFKKNVSRTNDCISFLCDLEYPSNYFILPIPSSSANLNQNMTQNAGY
jgi:hypothetical protein